MKGRQHKPAADRERRSPPPAAARRGVEEAVLELQRTAGNRATSAALGSSLPHDLRNEFEDRLGTDLSDVRVHADADADRRARAERAAAFVRGTDVYFRHGLYRPETRSGKQVLAHELAHVVQQTSVRGPASQPEALEAQADVVATSEVGASVLESAPAGAIQRLERDEQELTPFESKLWDSRLEPELMANPGAWKQYVDDPVASKVLRKHSRAQWILRGDSDFKGWLQGSYQPRTEGKGGGPSERAAAEGGPSEQAAPETVMPAAVEAAPEVRFDDRQKRWVVSLRGADLAYVSVPNKETPVAVKVRISGNRVAVAVAHGGPATVSLADVSGSKLDMTLAEKTIPGEGRLVPVRTGVEAPGTVPEPVPQRKAAPSAGQQIWEKKRALEKQFFQSRTPREKAEWARAQIEEVRRRHFAEMQPEPGSVGEAVWTMGEATGLHSLARAGTGETEYGEELSWGERFSEAILGGAQLTSTALDIGGGVSEVGGVVREIKAARAAEAGIKGAEEIAEQGLKSATTIGHELPPSVGTSKGAGELAEKGAEKSAASVRQELPPTTGGPSPEVEEWLEPTATPGSFPGEPEKMSKAVPASGVEVPEVAGEAELQRTAHPQPKRQVAAGTMEELEPTAHPWDERVGGGRATQEEQLYGVKSKEEWKSTIRRKTPPPEMQDWAKEQLPIGAPDPAFPNLKITEPASADHIVSVDRIRRMPGFAQLNDVNQLKVLNMEENFVAMGRAANKSKGELGFSEWVAAQKAAGKPVDEAFAKAMIAKEKSLLGPIEDRITELLHEQWATRP